VNEYCPATTIIENIHDLENRLRLQPGGDNHGAVERAIGRRANIRCYVYAYQAHIQ